jgi:hypothetical protein
VTGNDRGQPAARDARSQEGATRSGRRARIHRRAGGGTPPWPAAIGDRRGARTRRSREDRRRRDEAAGPRPSISERTHRRSRATDWSARRSGLPARRSRRSGFVRRRWCGSRLSSAAGLPGLPPCGRPLGSRNSVTSTLGFSGRVRARESTGAHAGRPKTRDLTRESPGATIRFVVQVQACAVTQHQERIMQADTDWDIRSAATEVTG